MYYAIIFIVSIFMVALLTIAEEKLPK